MEFAIAFSAYIIACLTQNLLVADKISGKGYILLVLCQMIIAISAQHFV